MSARCDFSYRHYRELVAAILGSGHEITPLGEYQRVPGKVCLWRHDVDFCLRTALEHAHLDHEVGVRATFFVRVHAPSYNILSAESARALAEMASLGHEIGLHTEPMFHLQRGRDPNVELHADVRLLSAAVGAEVRAVARHQPARFPAQVADEERYLSAYGPALESFQYFSDSRGL
ncbi:MAG TPA: hypothetical protein VM537_35660 [Anaerolineae bacterium]|nr:hypothetical protein [Anaerolineae bacterium]